MKQKIIRAALLFVLLQFTFTVKVKAATYYVATTGNDSNPGTITAPWLTVQKAANTLVAGDTVLIRDGTYTTTSRITPKNSGNANAWITYKAYPGEHPKIIADMSQAIFIQGTSSAYKSYIEINGLTLTARSLAYAPTESCGSGTVTEYSHHIRIINNIIEGSGGSGITFETGSDYTYTEGNIVYDNCWGCSNWRGSGINFHRLIWYDNVPGFHNIARRNIVYHNYHDPNYVKIHSDGNGFIVDESNYVNTSGTNPPVLIENNLIFDNAGPCVNIYNSSNTTIRNNTCYQNESDPYETNSSGELNIDGSSNIQAYNNIVVARTGAYGARTYSSSGLTFDYNLYYAGIVRDAVLRGANDILDKNPLFINASLDAAQANFKLQSLSPALDNALSSQSPVDDYDGNARPQGGGYDRGAFEFVTLKTGDINGDGVVNVLDYTLLSNAFGTNNIASDLNHDGVVNILDYTILSNNFGK